MIIMVMLLGFLKITDYALHVKLRASLRRACPFSTSIYAATGMLPALTTSDAHVPFPRLCIRLRAGCLHSATDGHILVPLISFWLQVNRPLTTSLRRRSPLTSSIYPATGTLPTLNLPVMRISPFPGYVSGNGCLDRSLLLSDTHPTFHR